MDKHVSSDGAFAPLQLPAATPCLEAHNIQEMQCYSDAN